MAWIRLSDDYNDHPKIDRLSDGAFRLWHQALGFVRKYQTDGYIPLQTVRKLKAYSPKRMRELMTPWKEGAQPLWHDVEGVGIRLHNYLDRNPSKEEENERRADSKERMRQMRERRTQKGVAPALQRNGEQTNMNVLGRDIGTGSFAEKGSGEKPSRLIVADDIGERAGRFCERFADLFQHHRRGARYFAQPVLDWERVCRLLAVWDEDRLEKLAILLLTTDDPWISRTDRNLTILEKKASFLDDLLTQWERDHGVQVTA